MSEDFGGDGGDQMGSHCMQACQASYQSGGFEQPEECYRTCDQPYTDHDGDHLCHEHRQELSRQETARE